MSLPCSGPTAQPPAIKVRVAFAQLPLSHFLPA